MDLTRLINYTPQDTDFIKILLFLLVFILVYIALSKVPAFKENKGVAVIISIAVTFLSIFYITEKMISEYILFPYSTISLLLILAFPFLIIFLFAHKSKMPSILRKLLWLLFGASFIYIWSKNYSQISETENKIYIAALIITLIMILADKQIHELVKKYKKE